MRPVKTLTNATPEFIQTTRDYACLVALIKDESEVKRYERYITFNGRWIVQKMGSDRYPMICGVHNSLHKAVFQARK